MVIAASVWLVISCAKDPGAEAGDESDGGDETGLPEECAALLPEQPGAAITFTIRNDRSEPIWIDPRLGCGSIPFDLLDPSGATRTWWEADCLCACAAVMSDPNEGCECPAACEQPALQRIAPGASWVTVWDARLFDSVALPESCAANPERGFASCDATHAPEPGEWSVAVGVWSAATNCAGDCSCEPGVDVCAVYGTGDGELLELAIPFAVPDDVDVLIAVP